MGAANSTLRLETLDVFAGEGPSLPGEPTLAYGAPFVCAPFEFPLMRVAIGGSGASPGRCSNMGQFSMPACCSCWNILGPLCLALKGGSLMPNRIPALREYDKHSVVCLGPVEKCSRCERDPVEACVRGQRLQKQLEVGDCTRIKNVVDDRIDVRRQHGHHL